MGKQNGYTGHLVLKYELPTNEVHLQNNRDRVGKQNSIRVAWNSMAGR